MTQPEIIATVGTIIVPSILPTTAIIISILRSDAKIDALSNRLDAKVDSAKNELNNKIDNLSNRIDSKLDSKVDGLRADIRGDISILDNIAYDHHGRLSRLETKPGGKPEA